MFAAELYKYEYLSFSGPFVSSMIFLEFGVLMHFRFCRMCVATWKFDMHRLRRSDEAVQVLPIPKLQRVYRTGQDSNGCTLFGCFQVM